MDRRIRDNLRRHEGAKGFTLIEVLVVLALLGVLASGLYLSFQTGIMAFSRTEEQLLERNEGDIFLKQFEDELKQALAFAPEPFIGNSDSIRFPARLVRYTTKGIEEGLFVVEYKIERDSLVRSERKLRTKRLRKERAVEEKLFKDLSHLEFRFLYVGLSGKLEWERNWSNRPYVGLPRGIQIGLAGSAFGDEGVVKKILLPHGILLKRSS